MFEELQRQVEVKVHATLDDKVAAVQASLKRPDANPIRTVSLTNWSWIAAAVQDLPKDIAA